MNRKVMLTISGNHSSEEQEDGSLETNVAAEYFQRNGTHYLLYEEKEEADHVTKSRIKFRDSMLELSRQGQLQTHMIFEEGKKHMTAYHTPYGQMILGVDTRLVRIEEQDKHIRVTVEYVLEADERQLSDSRIEIDVREDNS